MREREVRREGGEERGKRWRRKGSTRWRKRRREEGRRGRGGRKMSGRNTWYITHACTLALFPSLPASKMG